MSLNFPNESAEYREARMKLLDAERALRKQTEAVAAMRRALPPGGVVSENYVFASNKGGEIAFADLFEHGKPSLVLYSYMYGPDADAPCPSCTAFLDSLDGTAPHLEQQINLAVIASAPIDKFAVVAADRGWKNVHLLSAHGTTYNTDYHGQRPDGGQNPMMNVFTKDGDEIRHRWASEMLFAEPEPGQDTRHIDTMWPVWNILDVTPQGRGDWRPALSYG